VLLGRAEVLREPAVLAFVAGVSLLCLGDPVRGLPASGRHDLGRDPSAATLDRATAASALAAACALLLLFWLAVAEHALASTDTSALALRWAAIKALGPFFETAIQVVPGQPLVREGVYRWLRHPGEAGLLIAAFGACVLLGSRGGLVFWAVVLLPLSIGRVCREDRVLADAFGSPHERYAAGVGGLWPSVGSRRSA
jgi:protein-S-isoprenylcysteine O-methyltransferase Ste14